MTLADKQNMEAYDLLVIGAGPAGEKGAAQAAYFDGTLDFFIQNVFNFPTLSDIYKYAAYDGLGNLQRYREGQKN